MTEDRMRELFREMREEPVPADSLARVRMAVEERTAKRAGWWWRMAAALALAACAVVAVVVVRIEQVPALPAVAVVRQANPLAGYKAPRPVAARVEAPVRVAVKAQQVKRTQKVEQGPDVVVRIETADPDVVVLLVGAGE